MSNHVSSLLGRHFPRTVHQGHDASYKEALEGHSRTDQERESYPWRSVQKTSGGGDTERNPDSAIPEAIGDSGICHLPIKGKTFIATGTIKMK